MENEVIGVASEAIFGANNEGKPQIFAMDPTRYLNLPKYMIECFNHIANEYYMDSIQQLKSRQIVVGDKVMKYSYRIYGQKPPQGYALFIGMHGGGGCPKEINDQQWKNHKKLYNLPDGSLWITPRAPEDAWNMWHLPYIDEMYETLFKQLIVTNIIDPNKIYISGYSAGGDGTYKLSPRMADWIAGAAMCAGHPNKASMHSLRNTSFSFQVGGEDSAYDRNKIAFEYGNTLKKLQTDDPEGYDHFVKIHHDMGHWMNKEDEPVFKWLYSKTRNPFPMKVVWKQCRDVVKSSFYWLAVQPEHAKKDVQIIAEIKNNNIICLQSSDVNEVTIRLNDCLVNLDFPVTVYFNNVAVFNGILERRMDVIESTARQSCDPFMIFATCVTVCKPA